MKGPRRGDGSAEWEGSAGYENFSITDPVGADVAAFRPHNTAWTPAMSSMSSYEQQRIGGHNPLYEPHKANAFRLAKYMAGRKGWSTPHLLHADKLDRARHMRLAGISDEHIYEWGDDMWNTATHVLRQGHFKGRTTDVTPARRSPLYDTGPRDVERFDNEYEE